MPRPISPLTPAVPRFSGNKRAGRAKNQTQLDRLDQKIATGRARFRAEVEPHLLAQLQTLEQNFDNLRITVTKSQNPHSEHTLRFNLRHPEGENYGVQVGIARPDTSGLIFKGRPIVEFFSFFTHQKPEDSLYNSGRYTAHVSNEQPATFKPFSPGLRQWVKDLFSSKLKITRKHAELNPELEALLIKMVLKAAAQTNESAALDSLLRTGKLPSDG